MPKPYPREFRDDVVAVARQGHGPVSQVARDFGISESCLQNWLKQAEIEEGTRPGLTEAERREVREIKKRNRLWSRKTRCFAGRPRISRRRTCQKNDVPAHP